MNDSGTKFKTNNLIPKPVITLFKNKSKISKALRKVKNPDRCIFFRNIVKKIDLKLQNFYDMRLTKVENEVFEKSKENKITYSNILKS